MNQKTRHLYLASLPAAIFGCWNLGRQVAAAALDYDSVWQISLFSQWGILRENPGAIAAAAVGLGLVLPLLAVSLLVCWAWARLFSGMRAHSIDPGWHVAAWLFVLMLPASMPLGFAALALSFGFVFGSQVFGGTGRYIVHPSLLAIVFLGIAYPPLFAAESWLPGAEVMSTWAAVNHQGLGMQLELGLTLGSVFAGQQVGSVGGVSAMLCLLGLAYLLLVRSAHWQVVAAALAGLGLAGVVLPTGVGSEIPWHWQLSLGNFAFLLAFVAIDSTIVPKTVLGRVGFGALFGLLTVTLRTMNPEHPESSASALLLAMLCIPLLDYLGEVVRSKLSSAHRSDAHG